MNAPSIIEQLRGLDQAQIARLISGLSPSEVEAILSDWSIWALPHQRIPDGNWRRWIMRCGRGGGKALDLNTPIPTPDGWSMMGSLKKGDRVFDESGNPCKITFATEIQYGRPCFRVVFDDGSEIIADGDHRWFTWDKTARKAHARSKKPTSHPQVRNTFQIAATLKVGKGDRETNHSIPLAGSLKLPEVRLPVGPYTLGLWLGNGSTNNSSITTADPEVLTYVQMEGYEIRLQPSSKESGRCPTYHIGHPEDTRSKDGGGGNVCPNLSQQLKQLRVRGRKHIPRIYLRASYEQRLALLQGLMDSDGYCAPQDSCEFCNTNLALAKGVYELAVSLGIKATFSEGRAMLYGKDCGPKYRVCFTTRIPVFRLARKLESLPMSKGQKNRTQHRYIVEVIPIPSVPVKCITVDSPSHLYLAGESMIPTHNTEGSSRTTHWVARQGRKLVRTGIIGIVGRTHTDVRATCVEGPSGILATASKDFRPDWHTGTGLLVWPNGIQARVYSGDSPDAMRGPNFSFLWADEIAAWPDAENTWWTIIEPALRIGWARAVISTTPRPLAWLKKLEALADTIVTRATTYDNPYLAESALKSFRDHYEGTRIGKQELYGEIIEDTAGALWRFEWIEKFRVSPTAAKPDFKRIVIAVDPAVTNNEDSDETGIIVYGVDYQGHGYVLEDASGKHTPTEWATRVHALYNRYHADRVVAEINQGGDMVEQVLRAVAPKIAYQSVRATRGKTIRAEPVSALYERGMVHHLGVYPQLESQLCDWVPGTTPKSPDRLDALVYASMYTQLTEKVAGPIQAYM